MTSIEEYIEGLTPEQQQIIAKAAFAGIRWESYQEMVPAGFTAGFSASKPPKRGFKKANLVTYWNCILPDGRMKNAFYDIYECACWGLDVMFYEPPELPGFELLPENEQPRRGDPADLDFFVKALMKEQP